MAQPLTKAAKRWRRIAWVANALCLAAVVIVLGYDLKYGLPRYDSGSLWIIVDWIGPLAVALIALIAALVNMSVSSWTEEREPPSSMSEVEFQAKLRELEHKLKEQKR